MPIRNRSNVMRIEACTLWWEKTSGKPPKQRKKNGLLSESGFHKVNIEEDIYDTPAGIALL